MTAVGCSSSAGVSCRTWRRHGDDEDRLAPEFSQSGVGTQRGKFTPLWNGMSVFHHAFSPASQRFRMVQSLLSYWSNQYTTQARALNIGVDRIEIFNLRRVSRTTNRYVPIFKAKELGEYGPIERVFPNQDKEIIQLEEAPIDNLREDVYIDTDPPTGYTNNTYI